MRKDVELLNSSATLSLLGDRHRFAPYGLDGGEAGTKAESILNPDRNAVVLGSKEVRDIAKGDVVSLRLSGAGGYGPAVERDRAAIAELFDAFG